MYTLQLSKKQNLQDRAISALSVIFQSLLCFCYFYNKISININFLYRSLISYHTSWQLLEDLCIKPLIIIRLSYYLTSPLTKIETVTRTSQATFTAECPASMQEFFRSRLVCAYLQGPQPFNRDRRSLHARLLLFNYSNFNKS
jgi:hypothetical protein